LHSPHDARSADAHTLPLLLQTNWFNAPYTGPTTAAGASSYATYLEDSSTNKALTYQTAYQNFISGSSLAVSITSPYSVAQGNYGGMFIGCYAFQYGWIWQATATWVNMVKCVSCARARA
jgi:hypothetical protein